MDQTEAMLTITDLATDEHQRIKNLEQARLLLAEKTGVEFGFDVQHRILVSKDILPPEKPDNVAMRKMRSMDQIDSIIYQVHAEDKNGAKRIMVADVEVEKLRALQAQSTARLSSRPKMPRNDTPPRPSGEANLG